MKTHENELHVQSPSENFNNVKARWNKRMPDGDYEATNSVILCMLKLDCWCYFFHNFASINHWRDAIMYSEYTKLHKNHCEA